jgi:2-polyprenyl-3-methyl-5-hydroxy-6-metoxy-1,4-benzoquinol methylase
MTIDKIRADFDRLAQFDDDGWNHNNHYIPFLLSHMPTPCAESLEIGCGTGMLSRLMARRSGHVHALDLSPQMISVARARSVDYPNITYEVGDVLARSFPAESVDCVVSIATLHHLSMDDILPKVKDMLRPGGVLLVLDLSKGEGLPDLIRSCVALPVSTAVKLIKTGRLRECPEVCAAWEEHGRTDHYLHISEVQRLCRTQLPGAVVRKHLFWRYSLIWTKP